MFLMKRVDEMRVESEHEAEVLIQEIKEDGRKEGYEVSSYNVKRKLTKEDEYYIVKVQKVW